MRVVWPYSYKEDIVRFINMIRGLKENGYKGVIYNEMRENIDSVFELLELKEFSFEVVDLDFPDNKSDLLFNIVKTKKIPNKLDILIFLGNVPNNERLLIDDRVKMNIFNSNKTYSEKDLYKRVGKDGLLTAYRVRNEWETIHTRISRAITEKSLIEKVENVELNEEDKKEFLKKLNVKYNDGTPASWGDVESTLSKIDSYRMEKFKKLVGDNEQEIVIIREVA